jgi:RND family efflux transporter MFP subunit
MSLPYRSIPAILSAIAVLACGDKVAPSKEAPAKVTAAVGEADLATVTLTEQAAARLGIGTATVDSTAITPVLTIGGEVVVPPGHVATLMAPVAGTVLPPATGPIPAAGTSLSAGQVILRLRALPPDRDMQRTREVVAVATARLRQAEAEAERVEALWADRLVSGRDRDAVIANLAAARAAYDVARSQQAQVEGAPDTTGGTVPLVIAAPERGVLQRLTATAGQAVAAGAPLAEVARLDRLWIRVPLYAGDAARVDRGTAATVQPLGGGASVMARAISGPRSADPIAASVDLWYEVSAGAATMRPGERVTVAVPLRGSADQALSVPEESLVYDIHGNAWVYEVTAPLTYSRRRVEVSRVVGDRAVLRRGPAAGTVIVTTGVAELYGTEFGNGK